MMYVIRYLFSTKWNTYHIQLYIYVNMSVRTVLCVYRGYQASTWENVLNNTPCNILKKWQ